jgi:hypothetical protein
MNFPEPAVHVDQKQMDVLERIANDAGFTGEELARATLKRVLDLLESAQKDGESPPSNVHHLRSRR